MRETSTVTIVAQNKHEMVFQLLAPRLMFHVMCPKYWPARACSPNNVLHSSGIVMEDIYMLESSHLGGRLPDIMHTKLIPN